LLHLDLFGPTSIASLGGKKYAQVLVDDYFRFSWTLFLTHKCHAYKALINLSKKIQNEKYMFIASIISDHEGEFKNNEFIYFCDKQGMYHPFIIAPRTPQ